MESEGDLEMGCDHDFELGQITSDPWSTFNRVEFAYYYCNKCLYTVRKKVLFGLENQINSGDGKVT